MKDGAGDEDEEQQDEEQEAMKAELDNIAEEIIDKFQQDMQGVMENLDRAQQAFEDLSGELHVPCATWFCCCGYPWCGDHQCCLCTIRGMLQAAASQQQSCHRCTCSGCCQQDRTCTPTSYR